MKIEAEQKAAKGEKRSKRSEFPAVREDRVSARFVDQADFCFAGDVPVITIISGDVYSFTGLPGTATDGFVDAFTVDGKREIVSLDRLPARFGYTDRARSVFIDCKARLRRGVT